MSFRTLPRRGVVASEWTKLRSVRSTYLTMLAAAVGALLIGFLSTHSDVTSWPHMSAGQRAGLDPVGDSLVGFAIVQLAFGVLGVLAISSEYGTGMSRTTFAAAPRRRTVLAAKIAVTGALTLAIGEVLVLITFFLGQLELSARHLDVTLGDPHVLRALSGAGLYLAVLALVGLGLGAIIRHTAGAITALLGLVFALPQLAQALPSPWNTDVSKWTLYGAAQTIVSTTQHGPTMPSVPMALLVCAIYVALALGAAGFLITHRDI
jgi:ABC-2 type transport system permease protein